jgi:hypothetical protein
LIALLLLSGCKLDRKEWDGGSMTTEMAEVRIAHVIELDRWPPLERIEQRPEVGFYGTDMATIATTSYVVDINTWLRKYRPESPEFHARLRHEQEHARHQAKYGVLGWVAKYMSDREFMWAAEQRGWFYQLDFLRRLNDKLNPERYAGEIVRQRNLLGSMVEFKVALAWVKKVLAGEWEPPTD